MYIHFDAVRDSRKHTKYTDYHVPRLLSMSAFTQAATSAGDEPPIYYLKKCRGGMGSRRASRIASVLDN